VVGPALNYACTKMCIYVRHAQRQVFDYPSFFISMTQLSSCHHVSTSKYLTNVNVNYYIHNLYNIFTYILVFFMMNLKV
jgi:hypothetical protein